MRRDLQRRRARQGGASGGSHGRTQEGAERYVDREGKDAPGRPASAPTTTTTATTGSRTVVARGSPECKKRGDSEVRRAGGERRHGG